MKKRFIKILTIAFCMVAMFTISASAYNTEQPNPDYLPFVMEDSKVILWQMMPFDTFAIAKDTFPENQNPADIGNIVIAEMQSYTVLWGDIPDSGSTEDIVQIFGETFTAEEPSGFQVKVYDWGEVNDYYIINFGIYEISTEEWSFNPENYTDVDGYAYNNASLVPIAFYSNITDVAGLPFNRELGYWALSHFPMSNPFWEEKDNPMYNIGYRDGKAAADKKMFEEGKIAGRNEAAITEFNRGYNMGLQDADDVSFPNLIYSVIDAPISIITQMLNFEILGTNMTNFAYSLISGMIFLAVIKVILRVVI